MIYSMTGYANKIIQIKHLTLQIDIRSVNQRFLDLTIKCPEEFKVLENLIREKITSIISRGKIDLRIYYSEQDSHKSALNIENLKHYITLANQVQELLPDAKLHNISEILALPGILNLHSLNIDELKDELLTEISNLTHDLQKSQQSEGTKLAKILIDKVNKIEKIVNEALEIMPVLRKRYQEKLKQKLFDVLQEAITNESRFLQEFAYFCQKIDVDEELLRLTTHVKAFKELLLSGGIIGKKIDFITQEMHREANTFGAKSAALETTKQAIELKILIEQIREQVQNIM